MADNETHEAVVKLARGELEEHERINCWFRPEFVRALIDRLEAAHKRGVDALKQRCAELDAEVAAKDEVIKRLNDAISEEQRRKMATTEKSSVVGDASKLREALKLYDRIFQDRTLICDCDIVYGARTLARAALAAPPRNCDMFGSYTQAKAEWWKTEVLPRVDGVVSGAEPPFADWLFSPATEQEGGAK